MHCIRASVLALALLVAIGGTPALAAKPALELSGASPTLSFAPTTCNLGVDTCTYVFTNSGTGTLGDKKPVTWVYAESGTLLPGFEQDVSAATYTIVRLKGKNEKPGKPVVLHVIQSTYQVSYDNPATAPCSTGAFSAVLEEGAVVHGTFDCLGGLPSASMEFTIERGSKAERELARAD
jgi:hypothetical protein